MYYYLPPQCWGPYLPQRPLLHTLRLPYRLSRCCSPTSPSRVLPSSIIHSSKKWDSLSFPCHHIPKEKSWTHVDPRCRIRRYRLTHASVVGINPFVSHLLSSIRFVNGGGEGKPASTDSSVPTIVDTSTALAANDEENIPMVHPNCLLDSSMSHVQGPLTPLSRKRPATS